MASCDLKTGLCNLDETPDQQPFTLTPTPKATILYTTDPICSHCWAMEPAFRKLLYHYGAHVTVRHLYGGLLPGWQGFADAGAGIRKPADVAPHWDEVAQHYGQPIDASVWLNDPLDSSYPPSIALHLVRLIDPTREEPFLRRMREALFLEARNIARDEELIALAAEVGIDRERFTAGLANGDGKAGFRQDMQEVRRLRVGGFPTLIITAPDGQGVALRGSQPFDRLEGALLQVSGLPKSELTPALSDVLMAYGQGTTREFAEILGMDLTETTTALTNLGATRTPIAGDALWSAV